MQTTEFLLKSRNVILDGGVHPAVLHVRDGIIANVLDTEMLHPNLPMEDVGDLYVMPGLVDSHVHINEPGRTEWEGFETATKAAAAGGITTIVDMPLNSTPVTTTVKSFQAKLRAAEGKLWVDCGFYGGVVPGNQQDIKPLLDAGVLGMKAFLIHSGIDDFPNATEADLRSAMPILHDYGAPLLVHCELGKELPPYEGHPRSYAAYLASRPTSWEHEAIKLVTALAREYRTKTHVVHLASADAVPGLAASRTEGLPLTVETCPHYLYFIAEDVPSGDTRFKCAPPIRGRDHRERLWDALRAGVIDMIVSDHSPTVPALKCLESGDFQRAWGGIASLQLGLSIIRTEMLKRGFSFADLVRWMSFAPASLVGLEYRKGALRQGMDADIVIWDPNEEFIVDGSTLHHRHKLTPYNGAKLHGKVKRTYVRGTLVFKEGKFGDDASGKALLREG